MGWFSDAIPAGWLLLDGSTVSCETYPRLYEVLTGEAAGSGGTDATFQLPDLRGRIPVGKNGSDTAFNALGKTGGEKAHTLTTAEMASHSHSVSGTAASGGAHTHAPVSYTHLNACSLLYSSLLCAGTGFFTYILRVAVSCTRRIGFVSSSTSISR